MKKILSFFVLFLFVFGCSDPLQEELDLTSDLKSGNMVERPFVIHSSIGTMYFTTEPAECGYDQDGYPIPKFVVNGTGNATHLGEFTVENSRCMNAESTLSGVLTAANGDKIFTMVTMAPWMEDGIEHYYYSIMDGTGRFDGAKGYVIMYGLIDYGTMTFDLKGEGRIIY